MKIFKNILSLIILLCAFPLAIKAEHLHTWSSWSYDYYGFPCSEESILSRYCEECGAYETKTIPPTKDHSWTPWEITVKPNCVCEGLKQRQCTTCYLSEEEDVPKTDHTWTEISRQPSTCISGYIEYECSVCASQKIEELAPTEDHSWGGWTTDKEATINHPGSKFCFCKVCLEKKTQTIPALKPFIKFSKKTVTLRKNKSKKLKVTIAKGDSVKSWKSSKKKVAAIKKGRIYAKRKGITIITAITKTGKKAKCTVKVK